MGRLEAGWEDLGVTSESAFLEHCWAPKQDVDTQEALRNSVGCALNITP